MGGHPAANSSGNCWYAGVVSTADRGVGQNLHGGSDDETDYALLFWAGELPLRMVAAEPVADPHLADGIVLPSYIKQYSR